jgi:NAD(P)H-dependent FMN reductase
MHSLLLAHLRPKPVLKLKVIVTSTRPGRIGLPVGEWFVEATKQHEVFEVELIDLATVNLPLFDEPNHPMSGHYEHDHTKEWSEIVQSADAFVFIMPEYNYFAPATMINAIDFLHHEWNYKPAGIVSYGGVSAGTRSAQSVKPLLASVKMMPSPEGVFIPFVNQFIDADTHSFKANEGHTEAAERVLNELNKWATALGPLHTQQ